MSEAIDQPQTEDCLPGIVAELGTLQPKSLIFEEGMSSLFKRHPASIKRAVDRGELPPPVRMFGKNVWSAEAVTAHIAGRLAKVAKEREQFEQKVKQLSP